MSETTEQKMADLIWRSIEEGDGCHHQIASKNFLLMVPDNVYEFAVKTGGFWILDTIVDCQNNKELGKAFQVWKLKANRQTRSVTLQGFNYLELGQQILSLDVFDANFPYDEVTLYLIDGVIMLSEDD